MRWRSRPRPVYTSDRSWRSRISSHEAFDHAALESLGHDWERVAHPDRPARLPFKVYLASSVDDVVRAVREARALGERLVVRSRGHSSNDLVVAEGGAVLLLQGLDRVLDVDEERLTATVEAGCVAAALDDLLAERGLGLPVVGDHADITVGGFASVGGINAASHRHGMFVDNVLRLEYVDWDGELHACEVGDPDFNRLLCGLGRHGVITRLTVRVERVDKYGTILRNEQRRFTSLDRFVEETGRLLLEPPAGALYERGMWLDVPGKRGRGIARGQFSVFKATRQTEAARARDRLAYGYLHGLGYAAGRLPTRLDEAVKALGTLGLLFAPRYGSVKNVEYFAEKILDTTVGDPMRMFVVLLPLDTYTRTFRDFWELMIGYRARYGCFTFVSLYLKSVASRYLAAAGRDGRFAEFLFYVGVERERLTPGLTEQLVSELDDLCIRHGALRYMHSKTVKDPERVRLIDPNAYWTTVAADAPAVAVDALDPH